MDADEPDDELLPRPGEFARTTSLRDGTRVLLRAIRPEDRGRLEEGLRRLSPASRYLRFHSNVAQLTDEQWRYLTEVDHHDHVAIVAIDLDQPDDPGIGVARFIREPYERSVAEAAITVADPYHGRGAGTILLGALAHRAREEGVEVFRNYVLEGNHAMLEVFDDLGATRQRETAGLWRVDLRVPSSSEDVPSSPAGRAFLEAARSDRLLASVIPPIWSRWRRRRRADGTAQEQDEPTGPDDLDTAVSEELGLAQSDLDDWLDRREGR
ncbi:MAG: GNAT family N-acetyltransferase [Nitriliruptoraceae bacterium]|nr:GNAT family N-acetyltransferase [Nitriliruptoraceae bacterium]